MQIYHTLKSFIKYHKSHAKLCAMLLQHFKEEYDLNTINNLMNNFLYHQESIKFYKALLSSLAA